jgi:hypothetical protein
MLNNATREGARYAIVHGYNSNPSSGPPAPDTTSDDPDGDKVIDAARDAAIGLVGSGDLDASPPAWWECSLDTPPEAGDPSTGNNGRGQCVTVFPSTATHDHPHPAAHHDHRGVDPCCQQLIPRRPAARSCHLRAV